MSEACSDAVGVNDDEGPPVPIPNTEVKLIGGENTCLATDREDSTMPTHDSNCETAVAVFFIPVARQVFSKGTKKKLPRSLARSASAVPQGQQRVAFSLKPKVV